VPRRAEGTYQKQEKKEGAGLVEQKNVKKKVGPDPTARDQE